MLDELIARLPNVADVLALSASQIDAILLGCIARRATSTDATAAKHAFEEEIVGLYPPIGPSVRYQQSQDANMALTESWHRLLAVGLTMQAPGQARGVITLTAKGREAAVDPAKFEEITVRQTLRREMLHRDLQGSVYDSFASGHYDAAVRDAFVQVEVAVRDAVKPPASMVGVQLMRYGFNPNTGNLTDMKMPMPERERMADLFAGAIGIFKNPHSHTRVGNADPAPVIEELMFASRLLRFVKP